MAILSIQKGKDNPILRAKTEPLKHIDSKVKKLIKDMIETMHKAKGIGLAAPQVGQSARVAIIYLNAKTKNELVIPMINPLITFFSQEKEIAEEGCLSLPEIYINVERSKKVRVEFLNIKNQKMALELKDLSARIVQHEVDHLNGVLITDYKHAPLAMSH
ncbi:peptide deformylase [Candidatus Peregrinibacteria bacterium]|nr:peptide deformylase [Candidatus Peregrinibacteria bacterium]